MPLDVAVHYHDVSDIVLVTHKHDQITARSNCVGNMRRPDETDVNLTGKHRLRSPAGDNEHGLYFHVVLTEKPLLARHPGRGHVGIDRAVGEHGFWRSVGSPSTNCRYPKS